MIVDPIERLEKMGVTLPPVPKTLGPFSYLPACIVSETMFLSGILLIRAGGCFTKEKLETSSPFTRAMRRLVLQ